MTDRLVYGILLLREHNSHTTVENNAGLKQKSPLIRSYRDEVINSASFDLEWIPIKGKYQHNKTKKDWKKW